MSVCAHMFVLFRSRPTSDRLKEVEEVIASRLGVSARSRGFERITPVAEADLYADINDDGSLRWVANPRYEKLIGSESIDGRLHERNYLTRYWSDQYAEGPAIEYAIAFLVLLGQPDVEGVWYTRDSYQDGVTIPAMTKDLAHAMIDEFVRVGPTFGGRPVRYIETDSGHTIIE